MAKGKRNEIAESPKPGAEGDYEFKLPAFDEKVFIRREIMSARASFYTLGIGMAGGILAVLVYALPLAWQIGWFPIIASLAVIRPTLQKLGFPEDVTSWKALIGSYMMAFFTALGVWILGVNLV